MPIYFIRDIRSSEIKIGRSMDVPKRVMTLQTGNPGGIELMGWFESSDDTTAERDLHIKYAGWRARGEWFAIGPSEVLLELKSTLGFVPKQGDSFEVTGRDRDGIPEYLGVCAWDDFELDECCPFCGCFCGMHFQEASLMYHCIRCDTLTNFEELNPPPPDDCA